MSATPDNRNSGGSLAALGQSLRSGAAAPLVAYTDKRHEAALQ